MGKMRIHSEYPKSQEEEQKLLDMLGGKEMTMSELAGTFLFNEVVKKHSDAFKSNDFEEIKKVLREEITTGLGTVQNMKGAEFAKKFAETLKDDLENTTRIVIGAGKNDEKNDMDVKQPTLEYLEEFINPKQPNQIEREAA